MSTHALLIFKDADDTVAIFQHFDGYPDETLKYIEKAKASAWPLPRFEASEFAAAFIVANKFERGNIRIMDKSVTVGDYEYTYIITHVGDLFEGSKDLNVAIYVEHLKLYDGTLLEHPVMQRIQRIEALPKV